MEPNIVKLKDIKPALAGYINEAQSLVSTESLPGISSVHDVRVLMKKAKSVLLLLAPQLDDQFAQKETQAIREVGKIMSGWRDTTVFRKTLKSLKKEFPDIFLKLAENEKLSGLLKKTESDQVLSFEIKHDLLQIKEILKKSGYRLRFEPMSKIDPQLLIKELEVTYNHVVKNFMICRNNPKPSNLHEFRKRSKDFLYQLWFFRPLNNSVIKDLEKKLDILTQNLGKYNDLAQLLKAIGYKYEYTVNEPALDELAVIVREKQDRYLAKVWPTAHNLFCPDRRLANVLGFKILVI